MHGLLSVPIHNLIKLIYVFYAIVIVSPAQIILILPAHPAPALSSNGHNLPIPIAAIISATKAPTAQQQSDNT